MNIKNGIYFHHKIPCSYNKNELIKVYSIFTVEYQPDAFEKHAEKFRLDHLRLFFRWLSTIFYRCVATQERTRDITLTLACRSAMRCGKKKSICSMKRSIVFVREIFFCNIVFYALSCFYAVTRGHKCKF